MSAKPHEDPTAIKELLVQQVCASVRWEESIRWLVAQGFTRFIELGPGRALAGFMKRIAPDLLTLSVGDVPSLQAAVAVLQKG